MDGELTGEISKKNVLIIKTKKNEMPMAFNHSITDCFCGINLFILLFKNLNGRFVFIY